MINNAVLTKSQMSPTTKKSADISVRRADERDIVAIANISYCGFAIAHHNAFTKIDLTHYLADTFNPSQVAQDFKDTRNVFLVAEVDGMVIGTVRLSKGPPPPPLNLAAPVEITRLYLQPEWIGRGVGAALMQQALATVVDIGYQTCWLAVWEKNNRAHIFYQHWGFSVAGTASLPVGQSCPVGLVMTRLL